jgi:hypothetical protein
MNASPESAIALTIETPTLSPSDRNQSFERSARIVHAHNAEHNPRLPQISWPASGERHAFLGYYTVVMQITVRRDAWSMAYESRPWKMR